MLWVRGGWRPGNKAGGSGEAGLLILCYKGRARRRGPLFAPTSGPQSLHGTETGMFTGGKKRGMETPGKQPKVRRCLSYSWKSEGPAHLGVMPLFPGKLILRQVGPGIFTLRLPVQNVGSNTNRLRNKRQKAT